MSSSSPSSSLKRNTDVYRVPIQRNFDATAGENNNTRHDPYEDADGYSDTRTHHEYVLRGLRSDEIRSWSEFCAGVFSYKASPPPAEYFFRHYANDPSNSNDEDEDDDHHKNNENSLLVRVALYGTKIVASCRIFRRNISLAAATKKTTGVLDGATSTTTKGLSAGGIGEVCTAKEHRKRGLATALLRSPIAIMKEECMEVSSLHAGPAFFSFYRSLGYLNNNADDKNKNKINDANSTNKNDCAAARVSKGGGSRWSIVPFVWNGPTKHHRGGIATGPAGARHGEHPSTPPSAGSSSTTSSFGYSVRLAEFPSDAGVLRHLHALYSEQKLVGCLVRSTEYWTEYLSKELGGSLFVLVSSSEENGQKIKKETIIAWLSLKATRKIQAGSLLPSYRIQEFGMDVPRIEEEPTLSIGLVFSFLMNRALEEHRGSTTTTTTTSVSLAIPGFVRDELRASERTIVDRKRSNKNSHESSPYRFDWASERIEIDHGWMYRGLQEDQSNQPLQLLLQREHFVWPSDSF